MDGGEFFPAGTPLSPPSPPFSEHDWENGGGVFLRIFLKKAGENPVMGNLNLTPVLPLLGDRFGRFDVVFFR